MRRFDLRLLVVVVCLPLFAQEQPQERVLTIPGLEPEQDVIIELAEPPLLGRERVAAAAAALDETFARLERDLANILGDRDRVATNAASHAIRFRYRLAFAGASAHVHRDNIARIRALPYVKAVHVDQKVEAHLAKSVPYIGAPEVWQRLGLQGRGVTIAIIDTGIDYTHAALGKGFGPGFKVVGGYDFHNDDADPMDDNGHGTHVAGIAAGDTAPVLGVAPAARLLAYKVLDQNGGGSASTILAAIDRAADPNADGNTSDHVDVVNMSLGGRPILDDPLAEAVERATAAGVLFTISAGNAVENGSIGSPGIAPSAITVGAVNLEESAASFTSRGPVGRTWLLKPEVSAPGVRINSARRTGGTISASGTSMAAPHVAGLAALIIERHPDWTPAEVKGAIVSTAVPVVKAENPLFDQATRLLTVGTGRIDARRAVDATMLPSPAAVSFGLLPKRQQDFTATRSLWLTNRSDEPETLTLKFSELPAGATLTASAPSVTIDPGESATVELRLNVAKGTLSNEDFTAITGTIELTGSRSSLRVPWMLINVGVLSVTYAGTDPFAMALHSTAEPLLAWPESSRTFAAFVQYDLADVLVYTKSESDGQMRMLVREQLLVDGHTLVNLSAADAVHTVELDAVDVRGVPFSELASPATASRGVVNHFVKMPSWGRYWLQQPEWSRTLHVSSMPNTELRSFETLLTGDDLYVSMYPIRFGITDNVRSTVRASDWASQQVQHTCRTDCDVSVGIPTGSVHFAPYHALPTGSAVRTFHMVHPVAADGLDFRMYMAVREQDTPGGVRNPWSLFSGPWRNVDGRLIVSPFGRLTKADYASPARTVPMRLRQGPVTLRMTQGPRNFSIEPNGPLGDNLGANILNVEAAYYDGDGDDISQITEAGYYLIMRREGQGPYRLVASDVYAIENLTGKVTMTAIGNSSVYSASPTLSSLRVEDGSGAITTAVAAGSPARLVFSARQTTIDTYYIVHGPVVPTATKAWWRAHGTTDAWQPLPLTLTAEDYRYAWDSGPGTPGAIYAADLRAATSRSGAVDVKILIANEWGATSEIVYEPVVVVSPARRRSIR